MFKYNIFLVFFTLTLTVHGQKDLIVINEGLYKEDVRIDILVSTYTYIHFVYE